MLARLLQPIPPVRFFARMWGQRSALMQADADRFADLLPDDGGWHALINSSTNVDAATVDTDGRQHQTRIDPGTLDDALSGGATVCADISRHASIAALLQRLHEQLGSGSGRPFAKLYVSPPGAGFAPHFDGDHVFVVQLQGHKRWHYGTAPVLPFVPVGGKVGPDGIAVHTYPRDGVPVMLDDGSVAAAPERSALAQTTLGPGDVLYLPPGTWHTTQARQRSVALSISPARTPKFVLALQALREQLQDRRPLWPDVIAPTLGDHAAVSAMLNQGTQGITAAISSAAAGVTDEALALSAARSALARDATPEHPEPTLAPDTMLQGSDGGFAVLRGPGDDGEPAVFVFRPGTELELPRAAETFIRTLQRTPRCTVAQACGFAPELDAAELTAVLGGLVAAAVLRVVDDTRIVRHPVESSAIASVGFAQAERILEIEFRSGGVYRYYDVHDEVGRGITQAESIGSFFAEHVRDRYRTEAVPDAGTA